MVPLGLHQSICLLIERVVLAFWLGLVALYAEAGIPQAFCAAAGMPQAFCAGAGMLHQRVLVVMEMVILCS